MFGSCRAKPEIVISKVKKNHLGMAFQERRHTGQWEERDSIWRARTGPPRIMDYLLTDARRWNSDVKKKGAGLSFFLRYK